MDFYNWSSKEPLVINKYGIPEPISNMIKYPDILLIPLVAYDKNLNRVGYGGGYYDRYIEKNLDNKNFKTIGLGFSFQKYDELPNEIHDQKLNWILTEKYLYKVE